MAGRRTSFTLNPSSSDARDKRSGGLSSTLLGVASLLFAVVLVMPYTSWFPSLQPFLGNQLLRLGLLPVLLLHFLHFRARRARPSTVIALILLVLLGLETVRTYPFKSVAGEVEGPVLRVANFNSGGEDPTALLSYANQRHMDVVCLQEVWDLDRARYGIERHHWVGLHHNANHDSLRAVTVLLSRLPIVGRDSIATRLDDSTRGFFPVIRVQDGADTVTVIGMHLYHFARTRVLSEHSAVQRVRRQQVEDVLAYAETVTGPLVVLGDFNMTPTERLPRLMRKHFRDSWLEGGAGLGGTWPSGLPVLRIDYVFSRGYTTVSPPRIEIFRRSDHKLLEADLQRETDE